MIVDIFSSFDPHIRILYRIFPQGFWIILIVVLFLVGYIYWIRFNRIFIIVTYFLDLIFSQNSRTFCIHLKGFSRVVIIIFIIIIRVNFLGLLPYRFRYRRHIVYRLIYGLPLWLMLVASRLINNWKTFFAGLLPGGAPDWLNPFLVLVETIRIIVRPLTLSVRLVANMRAGHIVLRLVGIYCSSYIFKRTLRFSMLIFIEIFYTVFEIGICIIQGYIFCLLLTLYRDDHS